MGWEFWIYVAVMAVSAYVSYKNRPKSVAPKPAAFQDFDFPQSDEGTEVCFFFGDCWTPDWMVLTYGNYRIYPIKTKSGK